MARNQIVADRTRSRRGGPKMADNGQRKSEKSSKENANKDKNEAEVMIVSSSSSDSQNKLNEDEDEAAEQEEDVFEVDEDDKVEPDNKNDENTKKNPNQKEIESALYTFPMHRISRMMKSQDPDIRISQEAVFLINKASEKFLQVFCMEAYACSFLDHKSSVGYKHLSSVVCKRRRFDFLSDFVPERVKAEDALKEMPSVET